MHSQNSSFHIQYGNRSKQEGSILGGNFLMPVCVVGTKAGGDASHLEDSYDCQVQHHMEISSV